MMTDISQVLALIPRKRSRSRPCLTTPFHIDLYVRSNSKLPLGSRDLVDGSLMGHIGKNLRSIVHGLTTSSLKRKSMITKYV